MFGLSSTGFKRKKYADIIKDMEARAREAFGENVALSESSPLGMFIKTVAWSAGLLWGVAETVYNSAYPDTAEGVSLDNTSKFIGITRLEAEKATGILKFTAGEDGYLVPEGLLVQTESGIIFRTVEAVSAEDDGGGLFIAEVEAEAQEYGAEGNVAATTITEFVTPVEELSEVTNETVFSGGRDEETDYELRQRYERSVAKAGSSTQASIEATVMNDVAGVIDCRARLNSSMDDPDGDGIPAKSVAPVVYGGDDLEIAEAIFGVVAGGIESAAVGTTTVEKTVFDARNRPHVIGFARPDEIDIYVFVQLETTALFPLTGLTDVEDVIENYINTQHLGVDIIYTQIIAQIHEIPGISDILDLRLDIIPVSEGSGGQSNITITTYEVSTIGNIAVEEVV